MSRRPFPLGYVRDDLADFTGYSSARTSAPAGAVAPAAAASGEQGVPVEQGAPVDLAWLNANEAATPNRADAGASVRRYPDPQPAALRGRLAGLWGVATDELLVTRGSDEGIDLLVRACCAPGGATRGDASGPAAGAARGGVVVAPPTFGMYAVTARLHGAAVHAVPQLVEPAEGPGGGERWRVDVDAVLRTARQQQADLVLLPSPGNPTGQGVPVEDLVRLAEGLRRDEAPALLVVDEAYADFTDAPSAATLLATHENVVVLRTLSKAHGLAGARIGAVLARAELVALLGRVQAPYPLAVPAVQLALAATEPAALEDTADRVRRTLAERDRVTTALRDLAGRPGSGIEAVLVAEANFVTLRCTDPGSVLDALEEQGVVARALATHPGLADGVRVTLGTSEQDDRVLRALGAHPPAHRPPTGRPTRTTPEETP